MKQNKESTGETWKYLKGVFRSKLQKGKQAAYMLILKDCATSTDL